MRCLCSANKMLIITGNCLYLLYIQATCGSGCYNMVELVWGFKHEKIMDVDSWSCIWLKTSKFKCFCHSFSVTDPLKIQKGCKNIGYRVAGKWYFLTYGRETKLRADLIKRQNVSEWGLRKVVANYVGRSLKYFYGHHRDVWIIPSFQLWGHALHV